MTDTTSTPAPTLGARQHGTRLRGRTLLLAHRSRDLVRQRLGNDDGYTTETVIITAALAALALAVIAIIVAKVTGLANSISL